MMTAPAAEVRTVQLPEYAEALWRPKRYKILPGGRGASRSWTVARVLLIKGATSSLRILCAREFQGSIRDSVHQLLRDQIDALELEGYTVTDQEIRHTNGTLFLFEGLRYNVRKVKSLEGIDICWVEEAERVSKESWDVLIPTIRKDGSEIWVTFNPDQADDDTYDRFIVNTPEDAWVKHITWRDNPFFPDTLRKEMEHAYKVDPDSADHVWGGNTRTITDAQVLKGKWRVEEFTPFWGHQTKEECPDLKNNRQCSHAWGGPYQGTDFGFAEDPFASLRSWVHQRVLYVEYEVFHLHLDIDFIPQAVTLGIPDFAKYVSRADSSRPDSISYLKRHGLSRMVACKKGPNSVEDGVAHLRSYDAIVIHPRCRHFLDEAKRYSYKVDERSGDILPIIVDAHNHLMDCLRYALEPLMKPQRRTGFLFPGGARKKDPVTSTR